MVKNYQKTQSATQLEKAFNTITQAYKMSETENGPSVTWSEPTTPWNLTDTRTWYETYIIPYLSVNKTCLGANRYECWASDSKFIDSKPFAANSEVIYVILTDGTGIGFVALGNTYGYLYVDTNGLKKPNVVGKDIFRINILYKKGYVGFEGRGMSKKYLLEDHDYTCNKSLGSEKGITCGALIQADSWQIKDDYPWD